MLIETIGGLKPVDHMGKQVYDPAKIEKILDLYPMIEFGKWRLLRYKDRYYIVTKDKIRKFKEKDLYQIMKTDVLPAL